MSVKFIGVAGSGVMGSGITEQAARAGFQVTLLSRAQSTADKTVGRMAKSLAKRVEKGKLGADERDEILGRVQGTDDPRDLEGCELVIESVVEDLDVKRKLFAKLDRVLPDNAVLATNTSTLPVVELAMATERPDRVVGLHFFNPAPVLPLVEIVRAPTSSDAAARTAYEWAERAGKQPVNCNDTPGFIVNRILIPLLNDCVRVLDEARVTPEDLDKAMVNGAGWPLGPCALVDLVGIDVHVHASEALYEKLREERMAPPERLVAMQREGRLGRKTGAGFFSY